MVPHTFTLLRDDIANSIQPDWILRLPPSIRPLRGEGLIEREEDKVTYSLEELSEIAGTLAANYELFFDYLKESGLVAR